MNIVTFYLHFIFFKQPWVSLKKGNFSPYLEVFFFSTALLRKEKNWVSIIFWHIMLVVYRLGDLEKPVASSMFYNQGLVFCLFCMEATIKFSDGTIVEQKERIIEAFSVTNHYY